MRGISWASVEEWFNRIRGRLKSSSEPPPENKRQLVELRREGDETLLEAALNSRCTSDNDGDPKIFHWGMFDPFHKLRQEDIGRLAAAAKIPRINAQRADVGVSGNTLTFRVEKTPIGFTRDCLMVESGMQQQALCLACAALGAGMVFQNMGKDGSEASDGNLATIKIRVDAMKPSYGDSFWTTAAPGSPWLKGNLPEPDRKGRRPLLAALAGLKLGQLGHAPLTVEALGQLLWAARGRTPHLYKSRHWGMTIPTWAGEQRIGSLFLIQPDGLFEYINESKGVPTHGIEPIRSTEADHARRVLEKLDAGSALLVFSRNEGFARAFWEVGYQLLNAILQAASLGLSYQAILLDDSQKNLIESIGIKSPVAALALR
jgi:hypothetical protein